MAELVWLDAAMRLHLLVSMQVVPHRVGACSRSAEKLGKSRNLPSSQICWRRAESEAGSWAASQAAFLSSQKSKKAFQASCSCSSSLPSTLAWSAMIWALTSTSAMSRAGQSAAAMPVTGLFERRRCERLCKACPAAPAALARR